MTEQTPQELSNRIVGVVRDKAVADRIMRVLSHRENFAPEDVTVICSGVSKYDFGLHAPGTQVIRFPEEADPGMLEHEHHAAQTNVLTDWGIPPADVARVIQLLKDGDVVISINCGTRCDIGRSVFKDAGVSMVFEPTHFPMEEYLREEPGEAGEAH